LPRLTVEWKLGGSYDKTDGLFLTDDEVGIEETLIGVGSFLFDRDINVE